MCGQSTFEEDSEVATEVSQDRVLTNVSVPNGLVLRTDRVGGSVTYGDDIFPGETVRFDYDGGSERGERNVLVVHVDDEGFEGLTLERDGDYRRYLDANIEGLYDIHIVEPFIRQENDEVNTNEKRIRFDEAGEALLASLSGEKLAELYLEHVALRGDDASFDSTTGEVVVQLPEVQTPKFELFSNSFLIVNKRGDKLRVFIYPNDDEPVGFDKIDVNGNLVNIPSSDWTPEFLRDELVKFLA